MLNNCPVLDANARKAAKPFANTSPQILVAYRELARRSNACRRELPAGTQGLTPDRSTRTDAWARAS